MSIRTTKVAASLDELKRTLRLVTLAVLCLSATLPQSASAATLTRTSAFTYDSNSGLLIKEIIEPDNSSLCLVTEYVYDSYGNKTSANTRNCNGTAPEAAAPSGAVGTPGGDAVIAPRSSSNTYTGGQFPTTSTNALGKFETKTYDPRSGAVLTLTGPNGLTTTWTYDGFGRKTLETRADGTKTKWEYLYCAGVNGGTENCPTIGGASGAWVLITTPLASDGTTVIGPVAKTYHDGLNREIRQETEGFDGTGTSTAVYQDTRYDGLGRPYQKSRPYHNGQTACPGTNPPEPACWTTLTYDSLGRVYQENRPDETIATGAVTTYAYNGLSVTVTNSKGQNRTTRKNSQGQVVEVTDADGKTLSFAYDPFGNLTQTKDALNNLTTLTYDDRGRKIGMQDPDMGTWIYAYNALGQLIRQTDAKSQVSTMEYDLLGRMTRRNEFNLTSYWYYDTGKNGAACPKGIGKLCQAETDTGYNRTHSYDSLGRPGSTSATVDDVTYTTSVSYDARGRIATQTYPSGLVVYHGYTAKGYLKELRRDNETGPHYWQAIEQDAEGRLREQKFGNNVVTTQTYAASSGRLSGILSAGGSVQNLTYHYDSLGNIVLRTDAHPDTANPSQTVVVDENFSYDTLNRLKTSTVTGSGTGNVTKTYTYDVLGNITSRSDVSVSAANNGYVYPASGTGSVGPHAVSRVNLLGGGYRTYDYDANGNLALQRQYTAAGLSMPGGGRTAVFTSFNMPSVVWDDHATNIRLELSLYGPEHQRVKGSVTTAEGTRSTIYLHPDNSGGLAFEKETLINGVVEERNFITAGGQVVAVVKRLNGTWDPPRYFHRDNLGSTTAITDHNGTVIERLAYEPFGKRRFSDGITAGADDTGNTIVPQNTTRGFTNHEHIDELGIVHMNGRIYDPAIGRFLSADPTLQLPENLQNYNRYSYSINNPLRYIDPNGYGLLDDIFDWVSNTLDAMLDNPVKAAVTIAVAWYTGQVVGDWMITAAANSSTYSTALATWSIEGSVGTLTTIGSATVGASAGFAAGVVGSGGDIKEGFYGAVGGGLSGAINGYYGSQYPETRVIANSAAGGMGAVLRGEKFADGFKSSFAISSLAYLNVQMRNEMIQSSLRDPESGNAGGRSAGLFGDLFKLGGARFVNGQDICDSPLGGCQGGVGRLGPWQYAPGGFADRLVEAYAGPHDYLNSRYWYDEFGNGKNLSGIRAGFGEALNALNVVLVTPFAAAALTESIGIAPVVFANKPRNEN